MTRGGRARVPGRPAGYCLVVTERELVHRLDVRAPIAAVWAELTRRDGPQRAMFDSVLDSTLQPGDPLTYRTRDGRRVLVLGRVVEAVPPHRLVHTEQLAGRDDPVTLVAWQLAEAPGGTRITLRHSGWPDDFTELDQIDAIWDAVLPALRRVVETGSIGTGARVRHALHRAVGHFRPPGAAAGSIPAADVEAPLGRDL
jgi:uncharacterized protein YndB with AHSA1/START domain